MGLQLIIMWGTLAALLFYYLHKFFKKRSSYWPDKDVPNLKLDSIFARVFLKTFLDWNTTLYKQTTSPFGGYYEMLTPVFFVRDLDLIKNIYVKDFDHFVNRRNFGSNDAFNDMLFNQEDRKWKDLRTKMSPTFSTGKIRKMFPLMRESSKKLIPYMKEVSSKNNGDLDLEDALGRYAMDVISSAAFGIDSQIFNSAESVISKMANKVQLNFGPKMMLKFFLFLAFPSLAKALNFRFLDQECENFFFKILTENIKQRERTGEKRNDFLQLMIDTKNGQLQAERENEEMDLYEKDAQLDIDEKKKSTIEVDDKLIIANCIAFIFAGFDTTQSALIFGAYSLALDKDIQDKLRKEMQEAVENNGGELSYDIINQNEYLEKVINETLRMYPPAIRTERKCTKEYTVPNTNTVLPKDIVVGIPVYQIHRDEKYFPNPDVFNPENFSQENKAKRSPYAFMPFGHGPRNCIANRFALTEVKTLIASLVLNFEIEPCAKTQIPMVYGNKSSLKPSKPMWLNLKPLSC